MPYQSDVKENLIQFSNNGFFFANLGVSSPEKLLIIEGLDRAGKDAVFKKLHRSGDVIKLTKPYSDFEREFIRKVFISDKKDLVSSLSKGMAVVEFTKILSEIADLAEGDGEPFGVVRSFISTYVYEVVRGSNPPNEIFCDIQELIQEWEKTFNLKLKIKPVILTVSKEMALRRGMESDSFECINYDKIRHVFENEIPWLLRGTEKPEFVDTTNMTINEVYHVVFKILEKF